MISSVPGGFADACRLEANTDITYTKVDALPVWGMDAALDAVFHLPCIRCKPTNMPHSSCAVQNGHSRACTHPSLR